MGINHLNTLTYGGRSHSNCNSIHFIHWDRISHWTQTLGLANQLAPRIYHVFFPRQTIKLVWLLHEYWGSKIQPSSLYWTHFSIFQTPAIFFERWDQSKVGASEEELQLGIVTAQLFCQEPLAWMESTPTSLTYRENIKLPLRAVVQCHTTFLTVTHTHFLFLWKQERQKKNNLCRRPHFFFFTEQ